MTAANRKAANGAASQGINWLCDRGRISLLAIVVPTMPIVSMMVVMPVPIISVTMPTIVVGGNDICGVGCDACRNRCNGRSF